MKTQGSGLAGRARTQTGHSGAWAVTRQLVLFFYWGSWLVGLLWVGRSLELLEDVLRRKVVLHRCPLYAPAPSPGEAVPWGRSPSSCLCAGGACARASRGGVAVAVCAWARQTGDQGARFLHPVRTRPRPGAAPSPHGGGPRCFSAHCSRGVQGHPTFQTGNEGREGQKPRFWKA